MLIFLSDATDNINSATFGKHSDQILNTSLTHPVSIPYPEHVHKTDELITRFTLLINIRNSKERNFTNLGRGPANGIT